MTPPVAKIMCKHYSIYAKGTRSLFLELFCTSLASPVVEEDMCTSIWQALCILSTHLLVMFSNSATMKKLQNSCVASGINHRLSFSFSSTFNHICRFYKLFNNESHLLLPTLPSLSWTDQYWTLFPSIDTRWSKFRIGNQTAKRDISRISDTSDTWRTQCHAGILSYQQTQLPTSSKRPSYVPVGSQSRDLAYHRSSQGPGASRKAKAQWVVGDRRGEAVMGGS